jgi:MscS family membrane protein
VRFLLLELRKLLDTHPKVVRDQARVRFVSFGAYSLDLELFAYVDTRDANEFLAVREDIFLRIMDIVEASGARFAFPTQTIYLGRDGGRDPERAQAAEKAIAELRQKGGAPLLDLSPEEIEKLGGTRPRPPGSSGRGDKRPG